MASGRRSSRKPAAPRPAASRKAAPAPAERKVPAQKSNAGAQAQQQLPAPAPSTKKLDATCNTTAAITQSQSMELMQTFLYSGVSSILFLRDLLPSEHFGKMYYAAINTHCSYDVLTSGRQSYHPKDGERRPPGESMAVLKRDTNGPGDKIIRWLEVGVFDALKKGYLAEMQLSILQDDTNPTQVLELYSFTFQYSHQGDSSERGVSIQMNGPANTKVSLFNARQALTQVVKNMVTVNAHMPHLPDDRHLLMHIIYNDQRPRGYQAVGFQPTNDDISFPNNTHGWSMETEHLGQMFTGHQSVGLRVSYMNPAVAIDVLDDEVVVIPDSLRYGPSFSRLDPIETKPLHPLEKTDDPPPKSTTKSALEAMSDDDYGTEPSIADPSEHMQYHCSPTSVTQEGDREIQEYLQRAQQPMQGTSSPDTQPVARPHSSTKLQFSHETVARLDNLRSLQKPPREVKAGHSMSESDHVQCQCESSKREVHMIYCSFCDSFQHANCYGYLGAGLELLPVEHICYACLFADQHLQLSSMDYLVRLRRILVFLQLHTDVSPEILAESLNYRLGDILHPLKDLGKQGFVTTSPETRRSKSARKVILCRSRDTYEKMLREYFDPRRAIGPFLASPPTAESSQVPSKRPGDPVVSPRLHKTCKLSRFTDAPTHSLAPPEASGQMTPQRTNASAEMTPKIARAQDALSFKSSAWYTPSHNKYL